MPERTPAPKEVRGFQSEWSRADGSRAGVVVGAEGVTVWERTGPGPMHDWGRHYSWEEWQHAGGLPAESPAGLLTRIQEVAPALPAPRAAPRKVKARRPAPKSRSADSWSERSAKVLGWSPGATPALAELARASGLHGVEPLGINRYRCRGLLVASARGPHAPSGA